MKSKEVTYKQNRETQMWHIYINGVDTGELFTSIRDRDVALAKHGA